MNSILVRPARRDFEGIGSKDDFFMIIETACSSAIMARQVVYDYALFKA